MESQDTRLQVLYRKENPILPQRQLKWLINKHWIVTEKIVIEILFQARLLLLES
jgi:hypothetical protein